MDRKTERGQMMIEVLLVVLMFAGFFLLAATMSQESETAQSKYRFRPAQGRAK